MRGLYCACFLADYIDIIDCIYLFFNFNCITIILNCLWWLLRRIEESHFINFFVEITSKHEILKYYSITHTLQSKIHVKSPLTSLIHRCIDSFHPI